MIPTKSIGSQNRVRKSRFNAEEKKHDQVKRNTLEALIQIAYYVRKGLVMKQKRTIVSRKN
jgi:hypothetical protein